MKLHLHLKVKLNYVKRDLLAARSWSHGVMANMLHAQISLLVERSGPAEGSRTTHSDISVHKYA